MDEKFKAAVKKVFEHEGGYSNDPEDHGGETNFGISKRSYPDLDIKALTREQAEGIYHRDWWQRYNYGAIEDGRISAKLFDIAVNIGPSRAHRLLQESLNETCRSRLVNDGVFGPETLSVLNSHPFPEYLLAAFRLALIRFYLDLKQPGFLSGWVRRAIE